MKFVAWKHLGFQQEKCKDKTGSKSRILAEVGLELTPGIFLDILPSGDHVRCCARLPVAWFWPTRAIEAMRAKVDVERNVFMAVVLKGEVLVSRLV